MIRNVLKEPRKQWFTNNQSLSLFIKLMLLTVSKTLKESVKITSS